MDNFNLFNRFMESHVQMHKAQKSPIFIETPEGRQLSYQYCFEKSAQIAHVLIKQGLKPGDRVAVQTDKSPELIILYLAVLQAGGVYLPLNNAYTDQELIYFLEDARPHVFICTPSQKEHLLPLAHGCGVGVTLSLGDDQTGDLMDLSANESISFESVFRDKDDLASILYTSGTTGRSKGAMISHENMHSNAQTLVSFWEMSKNDVLLHALPIFHIHGLFVACNSILMAGAKMLFLPKFNVADLMRALPNTNVLMGVPTFYTRLLDHPDFCKDSVAHMRLMISGSAPMTQEVHKEFHARTGKIILERYGMTETGMNTSNPYAPENKRIPGTVGYPLPDVEIRITQLDQLPTQILPTDEIGMIEIKGPNIFKGYWNMPDKTAEAFSEDGYFVTGDIGKIDNAGYIHILGRSKDMIISCGYNIYPKEIEQIVDEFAPVLESAVIGLLDRDLGEKVVCVIVLNQAMSMLEDEVIAKLKSVLAPYKVPRQILFIDELPRNVMGKVQKNILREMYLVSE